MKVTAETTIHRWLPFMFAIWSQRSLCRIEAESIQVECVTLHYVLGNHKGSKFYL